MTKWFTWGFSNLQQTPQWAGWDVNWPSSSVDENIAVYDSTTGKLIKDWWVKLSELIVNWVQIYYVGKNWSDSNDWLTTEKAFLTFWVAITEASTQTPASDNKFVIYCDDAWIYTENITVPEWVDIKATSATIVWSVTLADNQSIRLCTVNKFIKSSWTGRTFLDVCKIETPDWEIWLANSTTAWELVVYAREVIAPLNWKGIYNTSTWITHCNINDVTITWDNGIWIHTTDWEINWRVDTINEEWTPTSAIWIKVDAWHIDITASNIECDTVYDVAADSVLRLTVQHLIGTETVADWWDAQISNASKSTDDLAATWLVNWTWVVTINVDDTLLDIASWIYYIQGTRYVYAWWTAITPTIVAWDSSTWVWFNSSWLFYSATAFTTLQTRTILPLARLQAVQWESWPWSSLQSPIDLRYIISEPWYLDRNYQENAIWVLYDNWGTYTESSTALQVDQSAWLFYDPQKKPVNINADTDIVANELYHISGSWSLQTDATLITPLYYDDWTDRVVLAVNKWASHTLLRAQKEDDSFVLVYSPAIYDSEAEAEAAWIYYWLLVWQESWFTAVASIIIKGSSVNIDSIADRRPFVWGTSPWVIGTATKQQVYDNSSTPETVTDSVRWADTWKRGSAADTDDVLEVLNGSDVQTFAVTWEWKIDATELTLDTALAIAEWGTWASTASWARTNLDVDQAWTDNSTDVTLAWTPNYITIAWQVITRALIDLTSHITGILPIANWGTWSATKNFVDLTTDQSKAWSLTLTTKALNQFNWVNIASATTTDIWAATWNSPHITGTTTITGLGTIQAWTQRTVTFDWILILTHNATSLILPTGANITTAAWDTADLISEWSGNWRCVNYQRADWTALASAWWVSYPSNIYVSSTETWANSTVFTITHNLWLTQADVESSKYLVYLAGTQSWTAPKLFWLNYWFNRLWGSNSAVEEYAWIGSAWSSSNPVNPSQVNHQANSVKIILWDLWSLMTFKLIIQQMY